MTGVNGLPTALAFRNMSRIITDLKRQSEVARYETVTGRRFDLAEATDGNLGLVQQLEKAQTDVLDYRTAINIAKTRANVSASGLDVAVKAAGNIAEDILGALGVGNEQIITNSQDIARRELDTVFAGLSVNVGGRYIFSGADVDTPPLAPAATLIADLEALALASTTAADFETALDTYFNDPAGGFATNIYQGSSLDASSIEVAEAERLNVQPRADDQALKDLFRSLGAIAVSASLTGLSPDERNTALESSAIDLANAEKGAIDLRADLGFTQERLETVLTRNEAEETAIIDSLQALIGADEYEAATRLEVTENVLDIAFTATARLSQLSLVNYIR